MFVSVLSAVLFVASAYAAPVTLTTIPAPLSDKVDKVLSDAEHGFGIISSILASLGRGLVSANGRLSRVVRDVKRLEKRRAHADESMSLVILNHTALKGVVDRLEKLQPDCPTTWGRRGQMCYKFEKCQTDCSANDVRGFCEAQGATLAIIKSAQLNEFVSSLVTANITHCFAGARDELKEGEWLWPDGSRAIYTNWYEGEPNNSGGKEHCLIVWQHRKNVWNDDVCGKKLKSKIAGYVCEKGIWS